MVALLGLFQAPQVLIEFLLRKPCRAIQALQHRTLLVATPVGSPDAHQLNGTDLTRVLYKLAATQVEKMLLLADHDFTRPVSTLLHTAKFRKVVLLLVGAHLLFRQVFDKLDFIKLSRTAEVF